MNAQELRDQWVELVAGEQTVRLRFLSQGLGTLLDHTAPEKCHQPMGLLYSLDKTKIWMIYKPTRMAEIERVKNAMCW